mgnify:CR=1 FL=1
MEDGQPFKKNKLKNMNLYYYFSVNDNFFTQGTKEVLKNHKDYNFTGLASAKKDFLADTSLFPNVSYLSDLKLDNLIEEDYKYLTEVEKKYNLNVSEMIHSERHFLKLEKNKKIKYALEIIKQIERDYEKQKFDIIFSSSLADFTSYFLFNFAKAKGIAFYYFVYSRMGGTVFLTDREDTGPLNLETIFDENLKEYNSSTNNFAKTKSFIESYIANKNQPYYVTQGSMLYKAFSFDDVKVLYNSYKNYLKDKNSFIQTENPLLLPFNRLKKIKRKREYIKYFKNGFLSLKDLESKKYFVYPLHFHPEAATLIQGRWFNDQKNIIEMISKALPADYLLIVKEHKVSIGRRHKLFYEEINKFHNVYFTSEKTEVYPLIQNSSGIVTISSSMGLEGVMLNKCVITFGDIHYNILSQVIKARDIAKMKSYINQAISFDRYKEDEYWSFFKTITENCYDMSGYSAHNFTDNHVLTFSKMIDDISKVLQKKDKN